MVSAFEVERFEWAAGDRLEVTGRWYGLRGHRFVRPVLVVQAGDEQRRMLALLEHKPWAADDGEEWIAAFPWEGPPLELTAAELAVAPSLAGRPAHAAAPRRGRQGAGGLRWAAAGPPGPGAADPPATPPTSRLAHRPGSARRRCRRRRAGRAARRARRRSSPPCVDWPPSSTTPVRASRPPRRRPTTTTRSSASATPRSKARDDALARANLDHDAIVEERDTAVHERSAALYERDEALDERAAANFERESAIAERDAAFAERDRAVEAHRAAVRDLEALEQRMAETEQARAAAIAAHGPARRTGAGAARRARRLRPALAGSAWAQRVVALIVLVVWAIVVYKVLHGLV